MKVREIILTEEQLLLLEYGKVGTMAGAIAGGALGIMGAYQADKAYHQSHEPPKVAQHQPVVLPEPKKVDPSHVKMAEKIVQKYKVDAGFAKQVVELAHQYAKPDFPTAKDIIAVVGVESSFDPNAVSGLRKDPAVGLMQVRPKVWNMHRQELEGNIEKQIATGSDILNLYYKKLHNKQAAIAAYNVGMGEYRSGNTAEGYVAKVMRELNQYVKI
jgi:hypothetical protein